MKTQMVHCHPESCYSKLTGRESGEVGICNNLANLNATHSAMIRTACWLWHLLHSARKVNKLFQDPTFQRILVFSSYLTLYLTSYGLFYHIIMHEQRIWLKERGDQHNVNTRRQRRSTPWLLLRLTHSSLSKTWVHILACFCHVVMKRNNALTREQMKGVMRYEVSQTSNSSKTKVVSLE